LKTKLCWVRILALIFVAALFLTPLSVGGVLASTLPSAWDHDLSILALPSSPMYPAVTAFRDFRMSLADSSYEKAEVLLGFANDDSDAIRTMAERGEHAHATGHCRSYQEIFDECVFWLLHAGERGNVGQLLDLVKTGHTSQQTSLADAAHLLPEESRDTLLSTRLHTAGMLVQAIRVLEGDKVAAVYAQEILAVHPELENIMPEVIDDVSAYDPPVVPPVADKPPPVDEPHEPLTPGEDDEVVSVPRIQSLDADRYTLKPQESSLLSVVLESGGADDLTYTWWCALGSLTADEGRATWTAPNRVGEYEIRVTVTDSAGINDSRFVVIEVIEDEPGNPDDAHPVPTDPTGGATPQIVSLMASADHKYIAQNLGGCAILVSRKAELHCEVADAMGLSYEWTTNGGGKITGSDERVMFTAPSTRSTVTVTVTVTNEAGETDTRSLTFHVTTCKVCFV